MPKLKALATKTQLRNHQVALPNKTIADRTPKKISAPDYSTFDQLNGEHPFKQAAPKAFKDYQAYVVPNAKAKYFNFQLAKEMGLISADHPETLSRKLAAKLVNTFALRIVNEYDQLHNIRPQARRLKSGKFMATRYLQLQHPDKRGLTSGDGRCIWNGYVSHQEKVWDVSSRGVGVTKFAPGVVEAGRPLKSGSTEFGYGCGLSELDELYSSTLMAEIFHANGINTERMLAIIDIGGGMGVGVRAAPNLLRPAHMFLYLKQNDYQSLKQTADYLIDRQTQNGEWQSLPHYKDRYDILIDNFTRDYANFVAHLDREYIFAWMDWDGDNLLANAGIIDYGSIRQFGLRHDQYKYDDVDRFSTNLNQQRLKARQTIQVLLQMVDYLRTRRKKPLTRFATHPVLKSFDRQVDARLTEYALHQAGFTQPQIEFLVDKRIRTVRKFYQALRRLESFKTAKPTEKLADGVNRPAILNMRKALLIVAHGLFQNGPEHQFDPHDLYYEVLSASASKRDRRRSHVVARDLENFQKYYSHLIGIVNQSHTLSWTHTMTRIFGRVQIINNLNRLTGNGLINIIDTILRTRQTLSADTIYQIFNEIISQQITVPEFKFRRQRLKSPTSRQSKKLIKKLMSIIDEYREDV